MNHCPQKELLIYKVLVVHTTDMKKASKIILIFYVLHNFGLLNNDYLVVVIDNIYKVNENQ